MIKKMDLCKMDIIHYQIIVAKEDESLTNKQDLHLLNGNLLKIQDLAIITYLSNLVSSNDQIIFINNIISSI